MPSPPVTRGETGVPPFSLSYLRFPAVLLGLLALAACSGDSPSEPPATDPPPTLPPDTIQTNTRTIGAAGGTVSLADGTRVVFPEGALSEPTPVTVSRIDPSQHFDPTSELNRAVLSTTAPISQFAREVEILIPLSVGMTEADSTSVLAGRIDPASGTVAAVPSTVRIESGRAYAVIETRHFSSWSAEWFFGRRPPPAAEPVVVPYYSQGATEYCWAVSLHMVMQAVNQRRMTLVHHVIGQVGVNEGGLTALAWRTSATIAGIVQSHTGVRPDRKQFDFVNMNLARDYIQREVGLNRRPVAVHSTALRGGHAVVVVGYDGNTMYVSDPGSVSVNAVGYTPMEWSQFVGSLGHNVTVLSIPAPVAAGAAPLAINFPRDALRLIRPAMPPTFPQTMFFGFRWDHTTPLGHSFRDPTEFIDAPAPADLPGEVAELRTAAGIELSNASRTSSRDVSVLVRVIAPDAPEGHPSFSWSENVTLAPNSLHVITPPTIWIDSIRHNTPQPTRYVYDVTLLDGTEVVDRQGIEFSIAGLVPLISSMTPASAGVGGTITLQGERFGQSTRGSTVRFNGVPATQIVSWSDTEIRVRVPQGADSGPVVVVRGEVASNAVGFTLSTAATVGGPLRTVEHRPHSSVDFGITWSGGEWSFSAEGAKILRFSEGDWFVRVEKSMGAAAELTIRAVSDFTPTVVEVMGANQELSVWEFTKVDLQVQPPLDIKYDAFDISGSDLEYVISATLTESSHWVAVAVNPRVHYTYTLYKADGSVLRREEHIAYGARINTFEIVPAR